MKDCWPNLFGLRWIVVFRYSKETSPLQISVFNLGSTLLLAVLLLIGLFNLGKIGRNENVLGEETSLPQVEMESTGGRLEKLNKINEKIDSEDVSEAIRRLLR